MFNREVTALKNFNDFNLDPDQIQTKDHNVSSQAIFLYSKNGQQQPFCSFFRSNTFLVIFFKYPLSGLRQFFGTESPLKMMKINFKIYDVKTWEETTAIHMLINISRSKCNQRMKLGLLIEYNIRNIFLEKIYTKCGDKAIPRHFSKKSKLSISLDQWSEVLYNFLLLYVKFRAIEILKLSQTAFFYLV